MPNTLTANAKYRIQIDGDFLYTQSDSHFFEGKSWLKLGKIYEGRDSVFTAVLKGTKFLLKQTIKGKNLFVTAVNENGTFFYLGDKEHAAAKFSKDNLEKLYYGGAVEKGVNSMAEVKTESDQPGKLQIIPFTELTEGKYTIKIAIGGVGHMHGEQRGKQTNKQIIKEWMERSNERNHSQRDCNSDGHRNEYLSGNASECNGNDRYGKDSGNTNADIYDYGAGKTGPDIVVQKPNWNPDNQEGVYQLYFFRCSQKAYLTASQTNWDCDDVNIVWNGRERDQRTFWRIKAHPRWDGSANSPYYQWYSIESAFKNCGSWKYGTFLGAEKDCDDGNLRLRPAEDWFLLTPAGALDTAELAYSSKDASDVYVFLDKQRKLTNNAFKYKDPNVIEFYVRSGGTWQKEQGSWAQGASYKSGTYKKQGDIHEFFLMYVDGVGNGMLEFKRDWDGILENGKYRIFAASQIEITAGYGNRHCKDPKENLLSLSDGMGDDRCEGGASKVYIKKVNYGNRTEDAALFEFKRTDGPTDTYKIELPGRQYCGTSFIGSNCGSVGFSSQGASFEIRRHKDHELGVVGTGPKRVAYSHLFAIRAIDCGKRYLSIREGDEDCDEGNDHDVVDLYHEPRWWYILKETEKHPLVDGGVGSAVNAGTPQTSKNASPPYSPPNTMYVWTKGFENNLNGFRFVKDRLTGKIVHYYRENVNSTWQLNINEWTYNTQYKNYQSLASGGHSIEIKYSDENKFIRFEFRQESAVVTLPYSSSDPDDMYVWRSTRGFKYVPQQGASEKIEFYYKNSSTNGKWVLNQPYAEWARNAVFRNYSVSGDVHRFELEYADERDKWISMTFKRENPNLGTSMNASAISLPYSSSDPGDMYRYGTTRGFKYVRQEGATPKIEFYYKDSTNNGRWVLNQPSEKWAKNAAFRNYSRSGDVHRFELEYEDERGKWIPLTFRRENPNAAVVPSTTVRVPAPFTISPGSSSAGPTRAPITSPLVSVPAGTAVGTAVGTPVSTAVGTPVSTSAPAPITNPAYVNTPAAVNPGYVSPVYVPPQSTEESSSGVLFGMSTQTLIIVSVCAFIVLSLIIWGVWKALFAPLPERPPVNAYQPNPIVPHQQSQPPQSTAHLAPPQVSVTQPQPISQVAGQIQQAAQHIGSSGAVQAMVEAVQSPEVQSAARNIAGAARAANPAAAPAIKAAQNAVQQAAPILKSMQSLKQ